MAFAVGAASCGASPAASASLLPRDASVDSDERDLRCYVDRYPDLLDAFCNGRLDECAWSRVKDHHETVGRAEGRTLGCGLDRLQLAHTQTGNRPLTMGLSLIHI